MHGKEKNAARSRGVSIKVGDEANLVGEESEKEQLEVKYFEWMRKTVTVMRLMHKFDETCSIRMLTEPCRLDLKYARSFTMAVKKKRGMLLESFPRNSVKTVYVSMSQFQDIREFKAAKKYGEEEVITTPLHLACQTSNVEAVRILLMDHNYDVNVLLYEKNFLYDLLKTA